MSENYEECFRILIKHEGGYSNHYADRGGMTFMGISRKFWPDVPIWDRIDMILDAGGGKEEINLLMDSDEVVEIVKHFYRREFWTKALCDRISNQQLASTHLNFAVNAGIRKAVRLIQEAANSYVGTDLDPDGIVGPATRSAVDRLNNLNEVEKVGVVSNYKALAETYYREIVANDSTQSVNLAGWLNRLA